MAGERLVKFPVLKSLSALGVNVRAPAISMDATLQTDSLNLSTGLSDGIGPRFGMAPIPNHGDQVNYGGETLMAGLASVEDGSLSTGTKIYSGLRRKVFAVFKLPTLDFRTSGSTNKPTPMTTFAWLISGTVDASNDYVDMACGYDGSISRIGADFSYGLSATATPSSLAATQVLERLFFVSASSVAWPAAVKARFQIPTTTAFCASAQITVSGQDFPALWLYGQKNTVGSSTVPAIASYGTAAGSPTPWCTRVFKNTSRVVSIFDIDDSTGLQYQFRYNDFTVDSATIYATNGYLLPSVVPIATASLPAATTIATRLDGAASDPTLVDSQILNDPDMTINSGYTMFLAACGGNPIAFLHKPWVIPLTSRVVAPTDLTSCALYPLPVATLADAGAITSYLVDGSPRQTCFVRWPSFVTGASLQTEAAAARTGTIHVTLGAADSGILRANTTYEFTFSIFNKLTGYETNVGDPAMFRTAAADYVALSIYRDPTSTGFSGGLLRQRLPDAHTPPWQTKGPANYLEYRFYYRELGEFEWKPALFIDAAKLLVYPNHNVLWACEGAIAGLPGGQPGGFNDYSQLPQGKYTDVVIFQERAFWCTEQAIMWSYRKNPFAYAGRNSATVSSGNIRGLKVHVYAGQREATNSSRILICASDAIYSGRFTGRYIEQPVQVSPDEIHDFPQEGSDFEIDFWTSFTAYTSRAMVIADGQLFYWGPNGVFWDDGGGEPSRISPKLEPDLFSTVVDPTKTNEVFGTYCEATREIFWFYPPIDGATATTGILSFNLDSREFLYGEIAGKIDAAQSMTIDREAVNWKSIAGKRVLLFARASTAATIQRAYYFDERNRGGDMRPLADMQIRSVATLGTATQWRLTLAQGTYNASTLAAISAGDYLSALQFAAYTRSYSSGITEDFIAKVLAVGATYIDVALPVGMDFSGAITFPRGQLPPLWHQAAASAGVNGFNWRIETNYWAPAGVDMEAFWKFLHMIFKVELVRSRLNVGYTLGSQTPQRPYPYNVALRLRDNFGGHDQTYAPLFFEDAAVQSQALKVILSGVHIGAKWVLQYLAAHGTPTGEIDFLKQFEPQKA